MDDATRLARCARCGADLPADAPGGGLCPACLLALAAPSEDATISSEDTQLGGSASSSDHATVLASASDSSRAGARFSTQLEPGQIFGPYRIEKLLGKGGMGEVYAAEHLEHGRRLALKVLSHRLADRDDRARFLREGQLAASINHPRSVYIFGSEEIDGAPIITMELVPGGTLKDKVTADGPYAPAAAVDAILDIVSGLDAAHAAGILHRDIKPSNCFVDHDGTVKIGDFGLSISTLAREATERTGVFQGTPQYAAPEQLRGEPLDVRADIYAVGATLYYLLTGRAPFDDADLTTLITRVKDEPARSPRTINSKVPKALAQIVLRCLAKDKALRPATYAALADELRPLDSSAPAPAPLGKRLLAGIIDAAVLSVLSLPAGLYAQFADVAAARFVLLAVGTLVAIIYFTVFEGIWGAAAGKRLCQLRVRGPDGQAPGLWRAAARALVLQTPALTTYIPVALWGPSRVIAMLDQQFWLAIGSAAGSYTILAVLFSTARRHNGFAAVHDWITGTRVVERVEVAAASTISPAGDLIPIPSPHRRLGPYVIVGTLGATGDGELLVGHDRLLDRRVWIHLVGPGNPPIAPLIRDVGRPTRLRWLNGRRTPTEAWDAFEALDGAPLRSVMTIQQPWHVVKQWVRDLANEVDSGLQDGSLPPPQLDRVWITRTSGARLLDFRIPGSPVENQGSVEGRFEAAQALLADVTAIAQTPLPLPASLLRADLTRRAFGAPSEVRGRVARTWNTPERVVRWRRAGNVVAAAFLPVVNAVAWMMLSPSIDGDRFQTALRQLQTQQTDALLQSPLTTAERQALERYVAGRFGTLIANPATWRTAGRGGRAAAQRAPGAPYGISELRRPIAVRVVAAHPRVSANETAAAAEALTRFLPRYEDHVATRATTANPADFELLALCLRHLEEQEVAERPAALSIYIAGRYGALIADERTWSDVTHGTRLQPWRPLADQVLSRHGSVEPKVLATATAKLAPFLEREALDDLTKREQELPTDVAWLLRYLGRLQTDETSIAMRTRLNAAEKQALETFVAGRFRDLILGDQVWALARHWTDDDGQVHENRTDLLRQIRRTARQIAADHAQVTPQNLTAAESLIKPWVAVYETYSALPLRDTTYPREFHVLEACVRHLLALEEGRVRTSAFDSSPRTGSLEMYMAGRFGGMIGEERTWNGRVTTRPLAPLRPTAERTVAQHPIVSPDALTAAGDDVEPFLDEQLFLSTALLGVGPLTFFSLLAIMLAGLVSAFAARGGLILRLMGIAVVDNEGREASRLRAVVRAAIAWSPAILLAFPILTMVTGSREPNEVLWLGGPCLVLAAGAAWAVLSPARGLQDRLAGTWLVPR